MSINWMRYFEILLEDNKESVRLSDLKVEFKIDTDVASSGSSAVITVYNLSQATSNAIMRGEYKKLRVSAGYSGVTPEANSSDQETIPVVPAWMVGKVQENPPVQAEEQHYGEIFSGEIRYAWLDKSGTGTANGIDRVLKIQAIDGHKAVMEASLNTTVAAGYEPATLHTLMMRSFNPYGVTAGATGKMPTTRFPRGRVFYQTTAQAMDNVAAQCRASWQFVDGKLQMVPEENYVNRITVLNSQTGMVASPTLTAEGITLKCLINPTISLHSLVQVNQAMLSQTYYSMEAVNKAAAKGDEKQHQANKAGDERGKLPADISADGVYIVKGISYLGDTRGTNWYMTLTCVVRDKQTPLESTTHS